MSMNRLLTPCPEHLEDEAFIIETSGEMPEVALAESLLHLGQVDPDERACLQAATLKGYLRLLRRDLDPGAVGRPHFRGLQRVGENLARLRGFLGKIGWELDRELASQLAAEVEAFLAAEAHALEAGRGYASCDAEQVTGLAEALGISLEPWRGLLARLEAIPCLDFRALAALTKLAVAGAVCKHRLEEGGDLVLMALDAPDGRILARAALPLIGPTEREDPLNRQRAELVWSLIPLPSA